MAFERMIHESGLGLQFVSIGAMFCLYFTPQPVTDYAEAKQRTHISLLVTSGACCNRALPPPSQFEACFISLALTDEMIEQTVKCAGRALNEVLE